MADALLALPFGLAIGLSLGLVGGGGAILAVPVLVYVLGQDVKEATTASLLIVGATALVGALDHARGGRVRFRLALAIGAGAAVGALIGTVLQRLASPDAILFLFSFLLFAAAYATVRRRDQPHAERSLRPHNLWLWALPAGMGIGVLAGFFGVGGGFLVVPVLVVLFGLPMQAAAGTSLLVIALASASGLAAHLASRSIDWAVAGTFAAAGIVGALLGSRISVRVPERRLREGFALLVVGVAAFLLIWNALAIL
jgi:uncharacterized membrane protein YfcA